MAGGAVTRRLEPATIRVVDAEVHGLCSPSLETVVRRFARVRAGVVVEFGELAPHTISEIYWQHEYRIRINPQLCKWSGSLSAAKSIRAPAAVVQQRPTGDYQLEVLSALLHELRHAWQHANDRAWQASADWAPTPDSRYRYSEPELDARRFEIRYLPAAWALYSGVTSDSS